jgi:hypothetical protein
MGPRFVAGKFLVARPVDQSIVPLFRPVLYQSHVLPIAMHVTHGKGRSCARCDRS